jgi:hypothetical protein
MAKATHRALIPLSHHNEGIHPNQLFNPILLNSHTHNLLQGSRSYQDL